MPTMLSPPRLMPQAAIWLIALISSACSSRRRADPIVVPPPPVVVSTKPGNGDLVEPDTVVTLELASSASTLRPGDVAVSDGGNLLAGTLARVGDSSSWTWTPDRELPRGCPIIVATSGQGIVASFSVRDIVLAAELTMTERVSQAYSWQNGRRAVRTDRGQVFEVFPEGLVERFVTLAAYPQPFGDGEFLQFVERQPASLDCVRANLDGRTTTVSLPTGARLKASNGYGDVVAFVPDSEAPPAMPGYWRLRHSETAFEFAGHPISNGTPESASIAADGTVSIIQSETGRVRLSRFAVGDLVGEHHELLIVGGEPRQASFGASADGRGVLAILVREPSAPADDIVQIARYEHGVGLRYLSTNVQRLQSQGQGGWSVNTLVGDRGSAEVSLSYFTGGESPATITNVLRVEPDDRPTAPTRFSTNIPPYFSHTFVGQSPSRAEHWAALLDYGSRSVTLRRSRPGGVTDTEVYQRIGFRVTGGGLGVDDSGRAILAISESDSIRRWTTILIWN